MKQFLSKFACGVAMIAAVGLVGATSAQAAAPAPNKYCE